MTDKENARAPGLVELAQTELVDDDAQFFAPVSSDLIDGLLGQYDQARRHIHEIAEYINSPTYEGVIHYFLEGNSTDSRGRISLSSSASQLFALDGALAALNAAYWSKALLMTDVFDYMPQKRRDEWNEQITNPMGKKADRYAKDWTVPPLPDFTEQAVRSTLDGLLAMRSQFLAERVDGIFRGLSGEHVTNAPEAFGKRMIIGYVLNEWWGVGHSRAGLINDLRAVIAKFMGRDEPKYYVTSRLIETLKSNWGEWVTVDGGALKIRLYKKGTAHLEVHPDMAWRLNMVLAHMYPVAIPAKFRQRPAKKPKDVPLMQRPLPFAVLDVLGSARPTKRQGNSMYLSKSDNKVAYAEAAQVLQSIGGVQVDFGKFEFDYWPGPVIDEIITSGCVPDHKSHQYYPTPEQLARTAVELAEIGDTHEVLEPSAGTGGIADLLPDGRTTCVEISKLHWTVLDAKGHAAACGDFLAWANNAAQRFDRVVMNPPFDQGRWRAHTEAAAGLLRDGGRLVAILPSGAKNSGLLDGWIKQWHGPYDNQFAGASVSVVILVAQKN